MLEIVLFMFLCTTRNAWIGLKKTNRTPKATTRIYQNRIFPQRISSILDPSPEVLSALPVYFRVKPTLRTPSGRRCRKSRTVFTEMQLKVLEQTFAEQRYLDMTSRAKLAQRLALNETQIKTWFQNRRMKHKKETKTSDDTKDSVPQSTCVEQDK